MSVTAMESLDTSSGIRRKKMKELKVELGQIGMRRGSAGSITSTPADIRHVDEWRMDLTAAEKRRLQQAEAKASGSQQHRPRFYLEQKKIKDGNFSKTLDEISFKEAPNTNLESNSLVTEANNRRRVKESVVREKSLTSLISDKGDVFNTQGRNGDLDEDNSSILSEVSNSDLKFATLGRKSSDLSRKRIDNGNGIKNIREYEFQGNGADKIVTNSKKNNESERNSTGKFNSLVYLDSQKAQNSQNQEKIKKYSQPVTLERQTSHTIKVYEEGKFHEGESCDPSLSSISKQSSSNQKGTHDGNLDHGYHSGSGRSSITPHSPSDSNNKNPKRSSPTNPQMASISKLHQAHVDPLSQSLPSNQIRTLLNEKPSSKASEKLQTKCVYDERMFVDSKDGNKVGLDTNETEKDYFEIMQNMNDDKTKKASSKQNNTTDAKAAARDNFKDFLSQSFSKTLPRRSSKVIDLSQSHSSVATISAVHIMEDNEEDHTNLPQTSSNHITRTERQSIKSVQSLGNIEEHLDMTYTDHEDIESNIDCIDLGTEDEYASSVYTARSVSPTSSMQTLQTEFGEPDSRGQASRITPHKDKNILNQTKNSRGKHEKNGRHAPPEHPCSRQLSNRVRSKMTAAKDKIRSTTPNMGFATGLLLWIPGFGSGKQNRSSMSTSHTNYNGNERTNLNHEACNNDQDLSVRKRFSNSDVEEDNDCENCNHDVYLEELESLKTKENKRSCATTTFLLAIDVFTIALIVILFSKVTVKNDQVTDQLDFYNAQYNNKTKADTTNIGNTEAQTQEKHDKAVSDLGRSFPDINVHPKVANRSFYVSNAIKLSDENSSLVSNEVSTRKPSVPSTTTGKKEMRTSTEPLFDFTGNAKIVNTTVSEYSPNVELTTQKETEATTDVSTIDLSNDVRNLSKQLVDVQDQFSQDIKKMYEKMSAEMEGLKKEIELLKKPPSFACHRTTPHTREGIITYSSCNVQNNGMNARTGKFTVQVPGVYHLSFTGLFHAENGHGVNADIVRVTSTGRTDYLGRSSADINEVSTFFSSGTDDDLVTTGTITTLYKLENEDVVYVKFQSEKNHGESKIVSNKFKTIHFIGQRISD